MEQFPPPMPVVGQLMVKGELDFSSDDAEDLTPSTTTASGLEVKASAALASDSHLSKAPCLTVRLPINPRAMKLHATLCPWAIQPTGMSTTTCRGLSRR